MLGHSVEKGLIELTKVHKLIELLMWLSGSHSGRQLQALFYADLHVERDVKVLVLKGERHFDQII